MKAEYIFGRLVQHFGFLSHNKVKKCFHITSQSSMGGNTLGRIFLKREYLTPQQISDICDLLNQALRQLHDLVYTRVAMEKGIIDQSVLRKRMAGLGIKGDSLSKKLLQSGKIDTDTHGELIELQRERMEEMPPANMTKLVVRIVDKMKESDRAGGLKTDDFIGERALGLGWIDANHLRIALGRQVILAVKGYYVPIGEVLVDLEFLSEDQYHELDQGESLASPIEGYQVLRKVGQGAMGVVYKAISTDENLEVALKLLLPKFSKSREDLARFLRSARLTRDLSHKNIVKTYDVGKAEDFYFQAMEFVRGEEVLDYMKRHGPMDEVVSLTIIAEVTSALAYLDSKGLVHRDIKPQNIMLSHMGEVKVTDLGIVRDQEGKHLITEEGISIGSPHYISPEQAMGENVDIRSDFYSMGATLYHMLVGEYPFTGRMGPEILYKQVNEPPPSPLLHRPDISPETASLIMQLMAKDPADRIQRPIDLLDAIRSCLEKLT